MDSPVPQLTEAVVEVTPQERVQNCFPEQIVGIPEVTPQGARAESFPEADRRCPCASALGGRCGRCTTGARA